MPQTESIALNSITTQRLEGRLKKDFGYSDEEASAVLRETLVFLKVLAEHPGCGISPSHDVDNGWHTFILYTLEYAEFCDQIAGRFIHHCPTDVPGADYPDINARDFFTQNGIAFDAELWGSSRAGCVGHGGPNCGTQIDPRVPCEALKDCNGGTPGGGNCTGCRSCGSV